MDEKFLKARKVFFKIYILIIVLTIIFYNLLNSQTNKLNGGALDRGYHIEGVYYILTYDMEYKEVPKLTWYFNKVLWITVIVLIILSGLGMVIFISTYIIPFSIKESIRALKGYKD